MPVIFRKILSLFSLHCVIACQINYSLPQFLIALYDVAATLWENGMKWNWVEECMRMKYTHQKFISSPEEFQLQIISLRYRFSFFFFRHQQQLHITRQHWHHHNQCQCQNKVECGIFYFHHDFYSYLQTSLDYSTERETCVCDIFDTLTTWTNIPSIIIKSIYVPNAVVS